MNIMLTSESTMDSALFLDDKRANKMIVESLQIICTVLHLLEVDCDLLYKKTHENHPCVRWALESYENLTLLIDLFNKYCFNYYLRTGKIHACKTRYNAIFNSDILYRALKKYKNIDRTDIVNCTSFKFIKDTYLAYQLYLIEKWVSDSIKGSSPKFNGVQANFLVGV